MVHHAHCWFPSCPTCWHRRLCAHNPPRLSARPIAPMTARLINKQSWASAKLSLSPDSCEPEQAEKIVTSLHCFIQTWPTATHHDDTARSGKKLHASASALRETAGRLSDRTYQCHAHALPGPPEVEAELPWSSHTHEMVHAAKCCRATMWMLTGSGSSARSGSAMRRPPGAPPRPSRAPGAPAHPQLTPRQRARVQVRARR